MANSIEPSVSNWKLPDDLIEYILLATPAKSLVKFKSVSKQWLKLITSNSFILSQHDTAKSQLLALRFPQKNSITLLSICKRYDVINEQDIDLPTSSPLYNVISIGFGIYFVYEYSKGTVSLWNLATRETKVLPQNPYYTSNYGFYFGKMDFKDGEFSYKVGQITYVHHSVKQYVFSLQLYSSKTKSWKLIPNFCWGEFLGTPNWTRVNLNGRAHWMICWDEQDIYITTFDYETEVFGRIGVPFSPEDGRYDKSLFLISLWDEKCLSLVAFVKDNEEFFLEIWVMYDYGVEDSWTKVFTVELISKFARVVGFSNKARSVFLQQMNTSPVQLLLCDSKSWNLKDCIQIKEKDSILLQVVDHIESLVPIS